jgi:DNA-binding response OmpR family regulator
VGVPPGGGDLDQTAPSGLRRLRALVVGDERDMVMNLGILLRSEGVDVELQSFVHVASAIERFRPDVALLVLATADRLSVAQELKERFGRHCPVLIDVARPYDPDAILKRVLAIIPLPDE